MSNAKLLRQLIKTGLDGDTDGFKVASEAVIREERDKKHHLLANDLERLLYGERSATGRGHLRLLQAKDLPINKDSGLTLVEERPVVRDETDIVLGDGAQSALDEVLMEHRRGDVLLAHGLHPAQRLLFCGPPGCGKTLAAEVLICHDLADCAKTPQQRITVAFWVRRRRCTKAARPMSVGDRRLFF